MVVHETRADKNGVTTLWLSDPLGTTQAGEQVRARWGDGYSQTILLHGQRSFDVVSGSIVEFPDGSTHQARDFDPLVEPSTD
jgi:hypothetical protein